LAQKSWANIIPKQGVGRYQPNISSFFIGLGRTRSSHFSLGRNWSDLVNGGETLHCSSKQWSNRRRRRTRMGGEGRGEADLVVGLTMVLTVALVLLLPNEVIVHWGATSLAGDSSSSSLCVFFFSFFSSLLCFLFFFLFICHRPLLHLCFSQLFIPCILPFLFFHPFSSFDFSFVFSCFFFVPLLTSW